LVCRLAGKRQPRVKVPRVLVRGASVAFEAWADYVSKEPPVSTYKSAQYMQQKIYFDNTKARSELGLPQTPLEESIRRAIEWYTENRRV
jgi:dihydroflavonol-4-reductase